MYPSQYSHDVRIGVPNTSTGVVVDDIDKVINFIA